MKLGLRFFGDGDDNSGGTADGGTPPPTNPPVLKTFSQDDVDKIVTTRLKKEKERATQLSKDLEELRKTAGLTEEEKAGLQSRIDELQSTLMTKEELAEQNKKKFEADQKKITDELTGDRDKYKDLYTNSTIKRAILDAAIANDGAIASQFVDLLSSRTRLVEEKGPDGKPTGDHIPHVKLAGLDKESKPIVLDLPVSEAVKQMKEWPSLYGNLFKDSKTGGVGATNTGSGPSVNLNNVSSSEEWEKARKQLGLT